MEEIDKYRQVYRDPAYKMCGSRFQQATKLLINIQRGTMADIGCGRGEIVDFANKNGFTAIGFEQVEYLCNGTTILHGKMPNIQGKYDVITSFDVMEHVLPDLTISCLENLRDICRYEALIIISTTIDVPTEGLTLHVNVRDPEEWYSLLSNYFQKVEMLEKSTSYGPVPFRCYA